MKTTGKLWNEYLNSWPEDWWLDESDESVNGKVLYEIPESYEVKDDDIVTFTGGCILKGPDDLIGTAMVPHFKRWIKSKKVTLLTVTVPNESVNTFKLYCINRNIKVSKVT